MKTRICPYIFILCPYIFFSSCRFEPGKKVPESHTIVISGMRFNPAELTLQKGDTVIFVNNDLVVHDITEEPDKKWTSSNLSPGQFYHMVVKESSTYYCSIHPTMKGKLIVNP